MIFLLHKAMLSVDLPLVPQYALEGFVAVDLCIYNKQHCHTLSMLDCLTIEESEKQNSFAVPAEPAIAFALVRKGGGSVDDVIRVCILQRLDLPAFSLQPISACKDSYIVVNRA